MRGFCSPLASSSSSSPSSSSSAFCLSPASSFLPFAAADFDFVLFLSLDAFLFLPFLLAFLSFLGVVLPLNRLPFFNFLFFSNSLSLSFVFTGFFSDFVLPFFELTSFAPLVVRGDFVGVLTGVFLPLFLDDDEDLADVVDNILSSKLSRLPKLFLAKSLPIWSRPTDTFRCVCFFFSASDLAATPPPNHAGVDCGYFLANCFCAVADIRPNSFSTRSVS
mmetsp:Transcript_48749/g.80894  ORF Transcript_48749/g.80894 Transcript_48749/m.80894 type:complete len:220 (+) Transcript_48749:2195-2854(+)